LKAKGGIPDVSTNQNSNTHESSNNIFVQVFGQSSADVSDAIPLGPVTEVPIIAEESKELEPKPPIQRQSMALELEDIGKDSDLVDNANLKRFRAKRADALELTIDVEWLKHLIHVLIENHSITITPKDVHDIMVFFDADCEIRIKKKVVVERDVGEPRCCGTTEHERQIIVETIQKIIVSGLNLIKTAPQFITFLSELGIAF
jgi:hypothetical protein